MPVIDREALVRHWQVGLLQFETHVMSGRLAESRLHEALIERTLSERLIGHISRDSTAIEGRGETDPESEAAGQAEAPAWAPAQRKTTTICFA